MVERIGTLAYIVRYFRSFKSNIGGTDLGLCINDN